MPHIEGHIDPNTGDVGDPTPPITGDNNPPWLRDFLESLEDSDLPTDLKSLLENAGFGEFAQYAEILGYDPETGTYDQEAAYRSIASKYGITLDAAKKYIIPFERKKFNEILKRLPEWEQNQIKNIVQDWNFSVSERANKKARLAAQFGEEGAEELGGQAKETIGEMRRQRQAMFGEDMSKEEYEKLPKDLQYTALEGGTIPGGLTGKQIKEEIRKAEAQFGSFAEGTEGFKLGGMAAESIRLGREASRTEYVSGVEGLRGSFMEQYVQQRLGGAQTRGFTAGATSPFIGKAQTQTQRAYQAQQQRFLTREGQIEAEETAQEESKRIAGGDIVQQILSAFEAQKQSQAEEASMEARLQEARDAGYSQIELDELKSEIERERALVGFEEERFEKSLTPENILQQYISGVGKESQRLYEMGFVPEEEEKNCEALGQVTCPDGQCADSPNECTSTNGETPCQKCHKENPANIDICYGVGKPCGGTNRWGECEENQFKCPDGTCVDDPNDCQKPPPPAKKYKCPDGSIVNDLKDCQKAKVLRCPDGTIVDDLKNCGKPPERNNGNGNGNGNRNGNGGGGGKPGSHGGFGGNFD